jgi:hypothetical protein
MHWQVCLPVEQRFVQALEVFRSVAQRSRLSSLAVHRVDNLVQDYAQLAKFGECRHVVTRRPVVLRRRSVGKRLPVFEFLVLVQEFDGDMTIGFLQDCCSALIERLDLVDDCMILVLVIDQYNNRRLSRMIVPHKVIRVMNRINSPNAAQNTLRLTSISSSDKCLILLLEVTSTCINKSA